MSAGWIGVDLDRTLAEHGIFQGAGHIGKPIPAMISRVKGWLAEGLEVRIFTARVSNPDDTVARLAIKAWCIEHIGQALEVTCVKDYEMRVLYDDRAVAVEGNTGRILGGEHHVGPANGSIEDLRAEQASERARQTAGVTPEQIVGRADKYGAIAEGEARAKIFGTDVDLAKAMYRAYNDQGPNPWKTFDGRSVPSWDEITDQVRGKWGAAAALAKALLR